MARRTFAGALGVALGALTLTGATVVGFRERGLVFGTEGRAVFGDAREEWHRAGGQRLGRTVLDPDAVGNWGLGAAMWLLAAGPLALLIGIPGGPDRQDATFAGN